MRLRSRLSEQVLVDHTADGFFSPRHSLLGFLPLRNAWSVVPRKGTSETTDKKDDVVNDDEYSNKGDTHCGRVR